RGRVGPEYAAKPVITGTRRDESDRPFRTGRCGRLCVRFSAINGGVCLSQADAHPCGRVVYCSPVSEVGESIEVQRMTAGFTASACSAGLGALPGWVGRLSVLAALLVFDAPLAAAPEPADVLIVGGTVITMDAARRVIDDGAVAIVGDRIAAV